MRYALVVVILVIAVFIATHAVFGQSDSLLEPITIENARRMEYLGTIDALDALQVVFSSDSRYLVTEFQRGFYRSLRHAADGRIVNQIDFPQMTFMAERIVGVTDQWLIMSSGIFDLVTNKLLLEYPMPYMSSIARISDKFVLMGVQNTDATIWEVSDDLSIEQVQTIDIDNTFFPLLTSDGKGLFGMDFPQGDPLNIRRWDIESGELLYEATQPSDADNVSYNANGEAYFFSEQPDRLVLYDVLSGEEAGELVLATTSEQVTDEIPTYLTVDDIFTVVDRCAEILEDENRYTCQSRELALFDTQSKTLLYTLEGGISVHFQVPYAISPDHRLVAFINTDADVEVWGIPAPNICRVTSMQSARLRVTSDASSTQVGSLNPGEERVVFGQSVGADGFTWWAVYGSWVRSDLVSESGACENAPVIE